MAVVRLEDPSVASLSSTEGQEGVARDSGSLIINADDWGRERETTDRTLECALFGTISSVSAMVFMSDSERAAGIARERRIDAALHLNFTTPFSDAVNSFHLVEHHRRLAKYLRGGSHLARAVFQPGLMHSFEYVVASQLDEFQRLYGEAPRRIDGHHHMHLCSNVLLGGLLPSGTIARRNFSFHPGEKNAANRVYCKAVDWILARKHPVVDFFYSLAPLDPPRRLERIFSLADRFIVEVETHPAQIKEYRFLTSDKFFGLTANIPIAPRYYVPGPARRFAVHD